MMPHAEVLVWTLYERQGPGEYARVGAGVVHSSPTRIDVLDPLAGFEPVGALVLPRHYFVPNGVRVVGVRPSDLPDPDRVEVEWLLSGPVSLAEHKATLGFPLEPVDAGWLEAL
jgi:hypothetical protein